MTSAAEIQKDYLTLRAGKFSVGYYNGSLRHIRYGDTEIIRNIYTALRDQNWRTYDHTIERESIERGDNHFEIDYDCFYQSEGKRIFEWNVKISGDEDGTISFEVNGKAVTDVLKNRAGICVLHPLNDTVGNECELLHPDGSHSKNIFPINISADNPFKDLSGFRWVCKGNWYKLTFEGDIFETEDQRNWCDASYKTFCTPLSKPFPVLLNAGETVQQKVVFNPETTLLEDYIVDEERPVEITLSDKKVQLPRIGIAASTEVDSLNDDAITLLTSLQLSHYRIEVHPARADWKTQFRHNQRNANMLDLPLEVALHASSPSDVDAFCNDPDTRKARIKNIIVLSPDAFATTQWLCDESARIRNAFPKVLIGAGTDHNYRELNCNPFDSTPFDFISYSIDPQEHAVDDITIVENIEAIPDTIISAYSLYTKPVHISSLTLRKRFNPAATVSADRVLSNEEKADPRQTSAFAAAFTAGSIKSIAEARAQSVTLYQTIGKQGIIDHTGKPYPVFDVLRQILADKDAKVLISASNRPLDADALLLYTSEGLKGLFVNHRAATTKVSFYEKTIELAPHEIRFEKLT